MSGGSMDYLYSKVSDASFQTNTPLRRAFQKHLLKVANALHDIEWVDSADCSPGDEEKAIRACLSSGDELKNILDEARETMNQLQAIIKKGESK